MTPENFDIISKSIQLVLELVVTSGLGGMAFKWLQAKGIDTKAILNNKLVSAAENAAPTLLKDVMLQGKSITDPAVIADVTAALKASLTSTHDTTIASLGASDTDVARIANNAVGKSVKASLDAVAQAASVAAPAPTIEQAAAVLTNAKTGLTQAEAALKAVPASPSAAAWANVPAAFSTQSQTLPTSPPLQPVPGAIA
jgi:hypothetical protein